VGLTERGDDVLCADQGIEVDDGGGVKAPGIRREEMVGGSIALRTGLFPG